jgi:exopolysaccharide biosynthesis protein
MQVRPGKEVSVIRHYPYAPFLAALLVIATAPAFAGNVSYYTTVSAGVPLKVISVNMNDPKVKVTGGLSRYGVGHAESFSRMIKRAQPTIAITGTFFSNRSLIPVGDIVIDGRLAHFGGLGTALCVTDSNTVEFVKPARYTHQDWSKYDFVLCSGPRLITNGKPYVEPWSEGFRDKHMLNKNGRVAVGMTRDNRMVFVATRSPVYLSKLAKAMRGIGVWNAINLDGGSSIGVYYNGRTLIKPSRALTNLILVYGNRWRYEEIKEAILPERLRSASR